MGWRGATAIAVSDCSGECWLAKRREYPQHLVGIITTGPPIVVAEAEPTHTDEWKIWYAQTMSSPPVLTAFQLGAPAAVFRFSRLDSRGYWSVQDMKTCSHGHTSKLGEARRRTCHEVFKATNADLVEELVYAEQKKEASMRAVMIRG